MTYGDCWLRYLRAHSDPRTRAVHYAGTVLSFACLIAAVVLLDWRFLVLAPILGYGAAWISHFGIEHNKPETFGHPLWSLASDYRMCGLFFIGRLHPHLQRAGVA